MRAGKATDRNSAERGRRAPGQGSPESRNILYQRDRLASSTPNSLPLPPRRSLTVTPSPSLRFSCCLSFLSLPPSVEHATTTSSSPTATRRSPALGAVWRTRLPEQGLPCGFAPPSCCYKPDSRQKQLTECSAYSHGSRARLKSTFSLASHARGTLRRLPAARVRQQLAAGRRSERRRAALCAAPVLPFLQAGRKVVGAISRGPVVALPKPTEGSAQVSTPPFETDQSARRVVPHQRLDPRSFFRLFPLQERRGSVTGGSSSASHSKHVADAVLFPSLPPTASLPGRSGPFDARFRASRP